MNLTERARMEAQDSWEMIEDAQSAGRDVTLEAKLTAAGIRMDAMKIEAQERLNQAPEPLREIASWAEILGEIAREIQPIPEDLLDGE